MVVLRLLGWILVVMALVLVGRDLLAWYDTGTLSPIALDQFWSNLDRSSLDEFEAAIQRTVAPWVWSGIVQDMLALWAAPIFVVVGLALLWLGRRRDDHASVHRHL